MKNKKIICFLPCLLFSSCLIGCEKPNDNVLKIVCIDAGYGREWIDEIAENFKTKNPGVEVEINALYEAESQIKQHLSSSKNPDDLYISVGASWKTYAASGYFLELDSFIEEEVDGIKIKDKISPEFANSIYFTKSSGEKKVYRLPNISGIGGIFFNEKMFNDNNWKIPTTYSELVTLCDTIVSSNIPVAGDPDRTTAVKPFLYTGTNTDYFDYTVFTWWSQLVGKSAIEEFLKYDDKEKFNSETNQTYKGLKDATKAWNDLFTNRNYVDHKYNTTSAGSAQKDFVNGYAAMMFNGDWLYNESLKLTSSGAFDKTFKLGLMKTPTLDGAKEEFVSSSYMIGEDQYIAIPKTSKKADLAKAFIKEIISDNGCKIFMEKAHGILAYKADYSSMNITDSFMQKEISLRNELVDKFTNFSSDRKYLINKIDIWGTNANRPFLSILNNSSNLDNAFNKIYTTVEASWDSWNREAQ